MISNKIKGSILDGNILKPMILFAIPIFLSLVLQQLFNTADMSVIGKFVGDDAQAAVGSTTTIVSLALEFFVGISVGVNVVISRFYGEKNLEKVRLAMHTAVLFSLFAGAFIAVVGFFLATPVLTLMNTPSEIIDMASTYLKIYFLGMPFYMLYNFSASIFRAKGNTKTPLLCLTVGGALNVVFNLFFVLVLKMNVDGVAIATVISNIVSSILVVYFLTKDSELHLEIKELKIDGLLLKDIIKIGLPSGFLGSVFSVSNVFMQSAVNSLGKEAVTASADATGLEIYIQFINNAFAQTMTTFIGQNYGAKNYERCDKIVKIAMSACFLITLVSSLLMFVFASTLLQIFTSSPAVIALAIERMKYTLALKAVQTVMDTMAGCLQGFGYTLVPALISVFGVCGIRLIWIFLIFPSIHTMGGIMMIYPITQAIAGLCDVVCYFIVRKKINMGTYVR